MVEKSIALLVLGAIAIVAMFKGDLQDPTIIVASIISGISGLVTGFGLKSSKDKSASMLSKLKNKEIKLKNE